MNREKFPVSILKGNLVAKCYIFYVLLVQKKLEICTGQVVVQFIRYIISCIHCLIYTLSLDERYIVKNLY